MLDKRNDFPLLVEHPEMIYFDNAATTQKPAAVINALTSYYTHANANVHRSMNPLADKSTALYEGARNTVARFINAYKTREVIFTRNTTESMNIIAWAWGLKFLEKGDTILVSEASHHSNIVPWQQLSELKGVNVEFIRLTNEYRLDIEHLKELLDEHTVKLVSLEWASNTLGVVHDIEAITKIVKKNGAYMAVDAAQWMAHGSIDVQALDIDFLAFSGHKMLGPMGIGVLWARQEILEVMDPFLGGGDMILDVTKEGYHVADIPHKFEAGTPNVAGAVGLAAAIEYLQDVGFDAIVKKERLLADCLFTQAAKRDYIEVFAQGNDGQLPVLAFNLKGVHAHDVAELLGAQNIMIRAGQHCTHPLHRIMHVPATARMSLSFYNSLEEIDRAFKALDAIYEKFNK
jgi:cysteine desulfurase/selenocysteine lyase